MERRPNILAVFVAVFLAMFLVSPDHPHPSRVRIPLSQVLSEKTVDARLSAICPKRALTQHSVSPPRRHNLVSPPWRHNLVSPPRRHNLVSVIGVLCLRHARFRFIYGVRNWRSDNLFCWLAIRFSGRMNLIPVALSRLGPPLELVPKNISKRSSLIPTNLI